MSRSASPVWRSCCCRARGPVTVGPALLVIGGSLLWSVGSFQASRVSLPADALVTTVGQMLGGALGLLVVSAVRGEQVPAQLHAKAVWALAYLVVLGSVVAFTAYSWLLGVAPVSQVATYAYVNPVVAVLLGALFADESLSVTSAVGGAITVVAVFLVVSQEGRARRQVPEERQDLDRSAAT